jgi:hypothetical protein
MLVAAVRRTRETRMPDTVRRKPPRVGVFGPCALVPIPRVLFPRNFGGEWWQTAVSRLSDRDRLHYAPCMAFATRFRNERDARRASVRATCSRCNTEVDLSAEESARILDAGKRSFQRHLVVVDTACRECGTNQRKMVVNVVRGR